MAKKEIKKTIRKKQEVKKLSKVGEWLESGKKSIIESYDLRAILK